jgi:hypothetical protein
VSPVSRGIDRIEVTFDEPNLVANAGLLLVATLVVRLGLERLISGVLPGRKVLTTPSWPEGATSIMPTCCEPVPPRRCCPTG